ncbi:queuosine salvage family protein [Cupriavidus sp. TMH.W2]|uniref:queuosine salvage family protein n=1 Tax=Cupriavidus sp. TMH.W2 TaxID=3434465 RepID=UPI003D76A85A
MVHIDHDAIRALKADFDSLGLYQSGRPFYLRHGQQAKAIPYLLAMTSLQYRFWEGEGSTFRRYSHEGLVGAPAMTLGFDRAWGARSSPGSGILACCTSTVEVVAYFGAIPDPSSRAAMLFDVLMSPRLGEVTGRLDELLVSGAVGVDAAELIADAFPTAFGDTFLKKAQLALILMVAEYRANGIWVEEDLFAFADYQVPNVLRHLGVLVYAPDLAELVDGRRLITHGSPAELSIRAAAVLACDEIAKCFGVGASLVDGWLWRQRHLPESPFHLTVTTAY